MHPDTLYQLALQRHTDDIARAATSRQAKAARRAPEPVEAEFTVPAPRPKFA